MGVKDFFKIKVVNDGAAHDGEPISALGVEMKLDNIDARVAIDASLTIYQSILALTQISSLTDSEGRPTGHINTIFNKVIQLAKANVPQVWVFDSPNANPLKKLALEKRAKRREDAKAADAEKRIYQLNSEHVHDIQELLKAMGIMYIISPDGIEAEQYGAFLTKPNNGESFCKYVITSDSDVLMFGGNMLRGVSNRTATGSSKKTTYVAYELGNILKETDLDYDQFVAMGVAMGTDFNEKTPRIGPASVMVKARHNKIALTQEQEDAVAYYKSDISSLAGSASIVQEQYNRAAATSLLVSRGFSAERVRDRLDAFEKASQN